MGGVQDSAPQGTTPHAKPAFSPSRSGINGPANLNEVVCDSVAYFKGDAVVQTSGGFCKLLGDTGAHKLVLRVEDHHVEAEEAAHLQSGTSVRALASGAKIPFSSRDGNGSVDPFHKRGFKLEEIMAEWRHDKDHCNVKVV